MIQKYKVAAYITQADWLLVFSEPDYPAAGIQIPGGTVEPGEDPDRAMLREAEEETGLTGLQIRRFLGTRVYHLPLAARDSVIIHRRFYQLAYDGPLEPGGWRHWETNPSEGSTEPIEFYLRWVKFPHEVPELSVGLGDMLQLLEVDG
ncbi:MAG: NUDIX domain-containing protein [Candidatus Promineifilaceae bacterium]|jgi:8-oxo-dGTP pyrophosphatase MutT (NUDIX family)